MNFDGLEKFKENPNAFIDEVRKLCWSNNIPVCFLKDEENYSISFLDEKTSRGLILENRDGKVPFMVDFDDDIVFPERDCPSIEECVARFWNMVNLEKKPYKKEAILNYDAFYKEVEKGNIKGVDEEGYFFQLWNRENEWRFEDLTRAEIKSAIVNSAEDVCAVAVKDKEMLISLIKDYINSNHLDGDEHQLENLDIIREMYEQISTMDFE